MTKPEGRQTLSSEQLEQLWAEHLKGEFETKDVETALATMVEDALVNHVPVNTGGRGKEELRRFYRDDFIPSWPEDLKMTSVNRVVGAGQLVDEVHVTFTHSKQMDWFLPHLAPTYRTVDVDIVVVVQFRGDKVACERIYWDHATVIAASRYPARVEEPQRKGGVLAPRYRFISYSRRYYWPNAKPAQWHESFCSRRCGRPRWVDRSAQAWGRPPATLAFE